MAWLTARTAAARSSIPAAGRTVRHAGAASLPQRFSVTSGTLFAFHKLAAAFLPSRHRDLLQ